VDVSTATISLRLIFLVPSMTRTNISRFHALDAIQELDRKPHGGPAIEIIDRRLASTGSSDRMPDEIDSRKVRQLFDYWRLRCGAGGLPSRRDVEPYGIADILPFVAITELLRDPLRVRFRLAGSVVDELHGKPVTGQWLDDIDVLGGHAFWLGLYDRLIRERTAIFGRTIGSYNGQRNLGCDWVLLPLSDNGIDVDRCLELEDWDSTREQSAEEAAGTFWQINVY
jgi:hypothetical protein